MSLAKPLGAPARHRLKNWDAHLIVALTFPFFMLAALVRRLAFRRPSEGTAAADARAAARTCAAFALMG